jgi:hypothetical protein
MKFINDLVELGVALVAVCRAWARRRQRERQAGA